MNLIEKRIRESELYKLGLEEGEQKVISRVHEYLEIIKKGSEKPEYPWKKELTVILDLLHWLVHENQNSRDVKEKGGV